MSGIAQNYESATMGSDKQLVKEGRKLKQVSMIRLRNLIGKKK
jgi:hypothetical protein